MLDRATLARLAGRPNLLSTDLIPLDFLERVAAHTGADAGTRRSHGPTRAR